MPNQYIRTELLLGREAMDRLWRSRVAVFGIGGVGGYVVEAVARSGIGAIDLIDDDRVCLSNLNRQLYATRKTLGRYKVDVAAERIAEINPEIAVRTWRMFYLPETAGQIDFAAYDYVVDAIDTVTGKISLVLQAQQAGTPILSSMGTGNKLDPTALEVADIYETSVCPLARIMRKELKKRGVPRLKVVYSKEPPIPPIYGPEPGGETDGSESEPERPGSSRRQTPGSTSFVPSAAGLIIASEIVRDLLGR